MMMRVMRADTKAFAGFIDIQLLMCTFYDAIGFFRVFDPREWTMPYISCYRKVSTENTQSPHGAVPLTQEAV
jgi:hypothetical protein